MGSDIDVHGVLVYNEKLSLAEKDYMLTSFRIRQEAGTVYQSPIDTDVQHLQ